MLWSHVDRSHPKKEKTKMRERQILVFKWKPWDE
jgi:hypothetical protein